MPFNFLIQLAIGIALMGLSYIIAPRHTVWQSSREPQDFETPKAVAGEPVPVIFGTITLKSPNILWEGESITESYKK